MTPGAKEAFEILRRALESLGVRFAVGGSWASAAYGEARFTNDIDILVDFHSVVLDPFLALLPPEFYFDREDARNSLSRGRPFNLIYMPTALKFDLFPARTFPLGMDELDRSVLLTNSGLSEVATPFVSPEDILLAKLHWFREGGEVSEKQWRDIRGIVLNCRDTLNRAYLSRGAHILGVSLLLERALDEGSE